ncbi:MAG: NAD(P)/FAD-dependent oxidoreductase, partial [Rhodothermales bacterium]|nr:NAD(P)/FAD-dependent oxidoreductase [Rhodothermales bacterium]
GLEWVYPDLPVAHPLDGGDAVVQHRDLDATAAALGPDGAAWKGLFGPLVKDWQKLLRELLRPIVHVPRHPVVLGRFARHALRSGRALAEGQFETERGRALFAGMAAHAALPMESVSCAAFGLMLALLGHAVGWPFPRGGAQAIADAVAGYLAHLGVQVETGHRVTDVDALPEARAVLLDLTPRQVLRVAGHRLPPLYTKRLEAYRYGTGVFKVDYALDEPVPWANAAVGRAGTVHVIGTLDELAASERAVAEGRPPERPFVMVAQHTPFDASRAPDGHHTLWTYCHVPHDSDFDMTERMEQQLERFAPGFRDRVLERHVWPPSRLEAWNPNLVGGDIYGGQQGLFQLLKRPVLKLNPYRTARKGLYLCSSSTPPGGGVHGMCGHLAAKAALKDVL